MSNYVKVYSGTALTVNTDAELDALDTDEIEVGTVVRVMGDPETGPVVRYTGSKIYILTKDKEWVDYTVPKVY